MTQETFTHLFEMNLEYKQDKAPVSKDSKVGEYIGSGEGVVRGRINGTVHWSLFEAQSAVFCASNLFGIITTDDGAEIKFDTMGFFRRPDEGSHIWQNSSGVSFETDDERYQWLKDVMGVWEGEFDMKAYRHKYQVYAKMV
ncbi:MAG: DUF3237 family protein [Anaerolineales bacterium]|nr:DUF3237 family protein [Anaerolineales bacterium]MCK4975795.1 DUF3237 family protein [Anaerolineales bacterium]